MQRGNSNRILITGGAGFIGSHLVDALMEEGKEVVVLDDLSAGNEQNISNWVGNKNFSFIRGDLLSIKDIERAIKECDTVFHLAGNPDVRIGNTNSRVHYEQNILCTHNLLECMRHSIKCNRIIFTS